MTKTELLGRLHNLGKIAEQSDDTSTMQYEIIQLLLDYINNPEVEDVVNNIPF